MTNIARRGLLLLLACNLIGGCHLVFPYAPGDHPPDPDAGRDGANDAGDLAVDSRRVDLSPMVSTSYVIDNMLLPTNDTEVLKYGWVFDPSDAAQAPQNNLGIVLSAVSGMGVDLQTPMTQNIINGNTVMLLRLTSHGYMDDPATKLQAWTGAEAKCCSSPGDLAKCQPEAYKTCFSGKYSFNISYASPKNAVVTGKIVAGRARVGPGDLEVTLPLGYISVTVVLKKVRILADTSQTKLSGGVLVGAISNKDLDNKILPAMASLIDMEYQDSNTTQPVKDTLKKLFDGNGDKTISLAEVKGSVLINTFMKYDVDIDDDGTDDGMSFGVGFSAVSCKIDGAATDGGVSPTTDWGLNDAGAVSPSDGPGKD